MWDIKDIKARGRAAFKANFWACVLVGLLLTLLIGGSSAASGRSVNQTQPTVITEIEHTETELTNLVENLSEEEQTIFATALVGSLSIITIASILLKIFLFNPLEVGCYRFFRKNAEYPNARVGIVGEGFGSYGHVFFTMLLRDLITALFALLLVIPGIMRAYSYALVPYLLKDEPNLTANQILARSSQLMRGNRWKAFVMDLSFLGWFILGIFTLGIVNVLWTVPYRENAKAALYLELSGQASQGRYA